MLKILQVTDLHWRRALPGHNGHVERLSRHMPVLLARLAERVQDDWGAQSFAVDVAIDPDRASRAGLTNADAATSTAIGLNGLELTALHEGDKTVPVIARLRMEERARLADLRNLYVYSSQGSQKVTLRQIASETRCAATVARAPVPASSPAQISRLIISLSILGLLRCSPLPGLLCGVNQLSALAVRLLDGALGVRRPALEEGPVDGMRPLWIGGLEQTV